MIISGKWVFFFHETIHSWTQSDCFIDIYFFIFQQSLSIFCTCIKILIVWGIGEVEGCFLLLSSCQIACSILYLKVNKLLLSKRVISGLDFERISLWIDLLERSYLRIFKAMEHKS